MKLSEWKIAKKQLLQEYDALGITTCEGKPLNPKCLTTWLLSIHHLDKRSSGKAVNNFEQTRLLCADCHHKADEATGHKEFNDKLKKLR